MEVVLILYIAVVLMLFSWNGSCLVEMEVVLLKWKLFCWNGSYFKRITIKRCVLQTQNACYKHKMHVTTTKCMLQSQDACYNQKNYWAGNHPLKLNFPNELFSINKTLTKLSHGLVMFVLSKIIKGTNDSVQIWYVL